VFQASSGLAWGLFYPAPEPTYAERQAQWVKDNDVKQGTKVLITRGFSATEDGSDCLYGTGQGRKANIIGRIATVDAVVQCGVHVCVGSEIWKVPFTVLEIIKEPTYRPFANAEEFKPYREKWCLGNLKGRFKIDWHNDTHIYEYGNSFITWGEAFEKYKFEDGTPFGVKEEA